MNEPSFDHRPDPELGAVLRAALEARDNHAAFVSRVMAQYDRALERGTVPLLDVLASWFRPGLAAAAALIAGFLMGRSVLRPTAAAEPASIEAAMAPAEGTGAGLAVLVTAQDPPDASVVYTSLVDR